MLYIVDKFKVQPCLCLFHLQFVQFLFEAVCYMQVVCIHLRSEHNKQQQCVQSAYHERLYPEKRVSEHPQDPAEDQGGALWPPHNTQGGEPRLGR